MCYIKAKKKIREAEEEEKIYLFTIIVHIIKLNDFQEARCVNNTSAQINILILLFYEEKLVGIMMISCDLMMCVQCKGD